MGQDAIAVGAFAEDALPRLKPTGWYALLPGMPVQERAHRTRYAILDAAATVFARRGYAGSSFSDLVRESGITKGAFYFHFSSKEELALEVMRHKQAQLIERMMAEVPEEATGIGRLAALLRARARALDADESLGCVLRLGAELGSVSAPASDYSQLNEWPIALFTQLVSDGQRNGEVRADLDARATGEAIFASIIGMDALASQLTERRDLAERTERLLDVVLEGLTVHQSTPTARRSTR
jgi:AcrR family transcriptional regulator